MRPESVEDAILTASEVARYLKVSERHVFSLVRTGRLPQPARLGGVSRWVRAEIDACLAGLAQSPS